METKNKRGVRVIFSTFLIFRGWGIPDDERVMNNPECLFQRLIHGCPSL